MTARPASTDHKWDRWLGGFPDQPRYTYFDLAWTAGRLESLLAELPDPGLLPQVERAELARWLDEYREDFDRESEEELRLLDPLAAWGVTGFLAGAAASALVPLLSVGLFVGGTVLISGGAMNQAEARQRRRLVRKIKSFLDVLRRKLRS